VFVPKAIVKDWEVWRLVSGFCYGGKGIGLLFDTFLLYRNSVDLEERHFQGRTASYSEPHVTIWAGAAPAGGGPEGKLAELTGYCWWLNQRGHLF